MDSAHPLTVLNKLNEQRSQGLFCDVTIVVEDVKFRAHKNILAACSRYFRNALTAPDSWGSSQVLELMDLKSEVFASILNFIYCSKVTLVGADDTKGLAAAGKRLGIPFLEMLVEERQVECVKSTNVCMPLQSNKRKKEPLRTEEVDGAKGPRITNAFSITQVCAGSNPFTPLDDTTLERQSSDVAPPSSKLSCLNSTNELTHTFSEHSYAVSKSSEGKESSFSDNKKAVKSFPTQAKQLGYKNTGPLKKRHRLRGILDKGALPIPAGDESDEPNTITPVLTDAAAAAAAAVPVLTPPPLFSETERVERINTGSAAAADSLQGELSPPPLSPQTEDSISIYSCNHCPEIFSNRALLIIHAEQHEKNFVGHLFCKFCHRKFIHLKRLRNHEQICLKAPRGPARRDVGETSEESDHLSHEKSDVESTESQLPSADLESPHDPEFPSMYQSEFPPDEKTVKLGGGKRRYNCSVCKRVYVTISSLKRHENVHSWKRAYPCHYCNKVFALAEYRTKHEIWHTGERRYQCIFCLETFMTYYILKNHQKSFHGIDPSLAVKKKSANGGLKASVYPLKLYRLLPMKFRKRRYKTYSHTFSERAQQRDSSSLGDSSLRSIFEDGGQLGRPDPTTFPLTFMATTKIVSPVVPRLCFDKPHVQGVDKSLNGELEAQSRTGRHSDLLFQHNSVPTEQPNSSFIGTDKILNSDNSNMSFLNSLNTVQKLSELSASAKRVEDMTKEILQSTTDSLMCDRSEGAKMETYIAKPACQGPSVDSESLPLCQITVKIGNEAIIRRQIKGSKLFPRKKRRFRDLSPSHSPLNSASPRQRLREDFTATAEQDLCEDLNDCDKADELWRPYYSYKAKKKMKKLKYKHRRALFHLHSKSSVDRSTGAEVYLDPTYFASGEKKQSSNIGTKHNPSRNSSPRATYSCDICDSSFITETGLRAHVIGSHPYFCKTCGKQGPPGEAPAGGDYVCGSCMEDGSCFDNTPRSPNLEKKYRCSFCPQRFLYLATKRSHEKKHRDSNDGYGYDTEYTPQLDGDCKRDQFKMEDNETIGETDIKQDSEGGDHLPIGKYTLKTEETVDSTLSTTYQDMSKSFIKSSNSQYSDSHKYPKVKNKMMKKLSDERKSMYLMSRKQTCERDPEFNKIFTMGPRSKTYDNHDMSNSVLRTNASEENGPHISTQKAEKQVIKEEPLF